MAIAEVIVADEVVSVAAGLAVLVECRRAECHREVLAVAGSAADFHLVECHPAASVVEDLVAGALEVAIEAVDSVP